MKPVIFHPEAEAELRAAILYYENQRSGLGADFQAEVEEGVRKIQQTPQAFSLHNDQGLRKFLVRRFPYSIFYLELDDSIWIAAVAHQKRKPGYWASRTPE
jgi:toxin ParE1/3/4